MTDSKQSSYSISAVLRWLV